MPRAASSRPPPKRRPAPNSTGWRKRKWPPLADLAAAQIAFAAAAGILGGAMNALAGGGTFATLPALIALGLPANIDRKSVVEGKSVSVRVDLGGRRILKKTTIIVTELISQIYNYLQVPCSPRHRSSIIHSSIE